MTVSLYSQLKQQVQVAVFAYKSFESIINKLKILFEDEINSPRRFEQIKTIGELLNILEIRDVLSGENVEPLKRIVEELTKIGEPKQKDLLQRIFDSIVNYQASVIAVEHGNCYAEQTVKKHSSKPPKVENIQRTNKNIPYANMSAEKRRRILRTIIEEIGNEWRDLARNLKIRERVINEVDYNQSTLAKKATKIMEVYLEVKAEPDKWFFDLCDALDKTRRKDLSKSLRKILLMNI